MNEVVKENKLLELIIKKCKEQYISESNQKISVSVVEWLELHESEIEVLNRKSSDDWEDIYWSMLIDAAEYIFSGNITFKNAENSSYYRYFSSLQITTDENFDLLIVFGVTDYLLELIKLFGN